MLTYSSHPQKGDADTTLTTTTRALPALDRLAAVLEPGDKDFAIVTPD
ncbi:hypothetical protein I1A62_21890 [Rhodococcus sp. USK10]|nr:hypothetical protein [Rhodococcus sp. USK10]QYB06938.1 hypothetical protein I1A62_21890 [Rhodococcus sp. USK10]